MNSLVSRDVTARSIRTRIVEGGSGPPVLFVHGLFANHLAFDAVMRKLAPSYHVVGLDLPGFGLSEVPSRVQFSFLPDAYSEVLVDIIAALQLGRCHVVGHGFGGSVAVALAAAHPELVNHLVLISPEMFKRTTPSMERLWMTPVLGRLVFMQLTTKKMFRSFLAKHFYAPGFMISDELIDSYYGELRSPGHSECSLSILKNQQDRRADVARLSRLKCPTLVVAGRSDLLLTTDLVQKMVRQIDSAHVEFVDAGRSPHEEQPDRLAVTLRSFFPGGDDDGSPEK